MATKKKVARSGGAAKPPVKQLDANAALMIALDLRASTTRLQRLTDLVIEAYTFEDSHEAFAEALRIALDVRIIIEGEADRLAALSPPDLVEQMTAHQHAAERSTGGAS